MKRLLFLVNDTAFFIADSLPLARAAQSKGYDIHVLAPPHAPSEARLGQEKIGFHPLALSRRGINPFREAGSLLRIIRLLRTLRPDILHLMTIKPVLYGGLAARMANVPAKVSTITGMGYIMSAQSLRARLLRKLAFFLYPLALAHPNTRVIVQNTDDYAFFTASGWTRPEQLVLIRGVGVDLQCFSPALSPPPLPLRVVMAARCLIDKGVREFIAAGRALHAGKNDIVCVLAGQPDPGNPSTLDKAEIDAAVKEGAIEYLGQRNDIADIYRGSHIACLPSYREGLPKSLMEAAACGLPIITTDAPGCRDVVEQDKNGLLVPVRDVAALQEAILRLADDAQLRHSMGLCSRAKAEKEFAVSGAIAATLALYAAVSP